MIKTKTCRSRLRTAGLTLALLIGIHGAVSAAAPETVGDPEPEQAAAVEIRDADGLRAMAEDPFGAYVLAADIDMSGEAWTPFSFHGSLDGGGYAILNLTIREIGAAVEDTYDGNYKVYDTWFAGFFDELTDALVREVNLVNLRIDVETDLPCFIGGVAGYMANSAIENCSVQGILQLKAHDRMFGVGGIIGYGCGDVKETQADVTLVCIDTDASTRDEQFMGGVCAAGYPNIDGCSITISGFDSDHGYVHNGGLVGMYKFYPRGTWYQGFIRNNHVSGKITFFEHNTDRRAYCSGFIGETMNMISENTGNTTDFIRDEVFTYDVDLLPHACTNGVMAEEVTAPGCEFGYTSYVCETCGYQETDHYTLKVHDYMWSVLKEATTEEEGLREGVCKICGETTQEQLPVLEPEPEPEANRTEDVGRPVEGSAPDGDDGTGEMNATEEGTKRGELTARLLMVLAALLVFVVGYVILRIRRSKR